MLLSSASVALLPLQKGTAFRKKLDKTTFSIYPEGGYFRVEQDQDNGQGVYVKNYWNAVAAKALFESEAK